MNDLVKQLQEVGVTDASALIKAHGVDVVATALVRFNAERQRRNIGPGVFRLMCKDVEQRDTAPTTSDGLTRWERIAKTHLPVIARLKALTKSHGESYIVGIAETLRHAGEEITPESVRAYHKARERRIKEEKRGATHGSAKQGADGSHSASSSQEGTETRQAVVRAGVDA